MKQKIKINGVFVKYEAMAKVNNFNEIPQKFINQYLNGAWRLYEKHNIIYAIAESELAFLGF
jgi:hypothetical protein